MYVCRYVCVCIYVYMQPAKRVKKNKVSITLRWKRGMYACMLHVCMHVCFFSLRWKRACKNSYKITALIIQKIQICTYVYVCMCVCIYVYIYIYNHKRNVFWFYTYMHAYTHGFIIHTYMHTYMDSQFINPCIKSCIHTYITYIYIHIYIYIYTYIHTYM